MEQPDLDGSMTRVLVTGAAGFLGRWFVRHHLAAGDQVVGVDDLSSEHAFWPEELSESLRVQVDAGKFFASLRGNRYDLAYHFAAPVGGRVKIENDPLFNADSLRLDSQFFRWAVGRVGIAIYPSSSAVYGTSLQEGYGMLLQEGMFHPANPTWLAPDEMYGFTKLAGETLAWKAERYGLNTLCIRPFSGYGEGQSMEYPVPSILARAKAHQDPLVVWGTGEQKRDFIHVEDVVGATIARLNAGVHGYQAMNISSGWGTSFLDIAKIAARLAEYEPQITVDTTKPSGVSTRRGDNARMSGYYVPTITLEQGLCRVLGSL
jgi:GDP-L-fucose synthase